jgi:hypothetical protein
LSIRSLARSYLGSAVSINNPLKHNAISCRFRANMALLGNLAARRSAL